MLVNAKKMNAMINTLIMFKEVMGSEAIQGSRSHILKTLDKEKELQPNFNNRYNSTFKLYQYLSRKGVNLSELENIEVNEMENWLKKQGSQFNDEISQILQGFGFHSIEKTHKEMLFLHKKYAKRDEDTIGDIAKSIFSQISPFNTKNKFNGKFLLFRMSYAYPKYAICTYVELKQVSNQHYEILEKRAVCPVTKSQEPSNKDFTIYTNKGFLYKNITNYGGVILNHRTRDKKTIETFTISENNLKNSHIMNGLYHSHTDINNLVFTTPFFMIRLRSDCLDDVKEKDGSVATWKIDDLLRYHSLKKVDFDSIEKKVNELSDDNGINYFLSTLLVPHLSRKNAGGLIPSFPNNFDKALFEFYVTHEYENLAKSISTELITDKYGLKKFIELLQKELKEKIGET